MNTQELNKRKRDLLASQEATLNSAQEAKRKLTDAENNSFNDATAEIADIDQTLQHMEAIAKGKASLTQATSQIVIPSVSDSAIKKAFSNEYHEAFYNQFKNAGRGIYNTALGEGGTTDGGYLVPITVDGTIVPLAPQETALRQLAKVIPTTNDIKLPAQGAKTIAAAKAESRTGDNAFGGTAPSFTQVTLSAFMAGAIVPVTIELAQDIPALQEFLNQDISDGILVYEDNKFVNGSGSGEPQGVLTGAIAAQTAALSADAGLDLVGKLNPRYYANASWLMNRQTGINLRKKQIDANQFLPF